MEDVADGLDVSVEPTTAANAKRNPPAAAAVNRFMQDSARRSCSFVNLSSDARHELTKMARQNSFVLTSCQEPNVGMVTRLTRPKENRTACEKADGFQPGYAKHGWLCKCASCAPRGGLVVPMSPTTPDSPSSVMEPSSTVAPEKTPPSSPIVKGREYDVYNMCPLMGPRMTSSTSPSTSPPVDVPPIPRRISLPVDVPTTPTTASALDEPASPRRLSLPVDAPAPSSTSSPINVPASSRSSGTARRRPSDLMSSGASFATLAMLTAAVKAAEESDERPELLQDGTSGVYLLRSSPPSSSPALRGETRLSTSPPVAVFKPSDEEAGSDNNPRGLRGEKHMMREGFRPGDGAVRERVAYKLDHRGFARVPKTALERIMMRTATGTRLAEQSGSIQEFVPSQGDVGEYRFDGSEFCERASHRIALLDLRLFNCDRHEGNILVRPARAPSSPSPPSPPSSLPSSSLLSPPSSPPSDAKLDLVPIDHAFVLPRFGYFREAEFVWHYWLAANEPFGDAAIEYVANLDVEADVEMARHAGLDEPSCATLRTCTMLLQAALLGGGPPKHEGDEAKEAGGGGEKGDETARGVTPKDLARIWMRQPFDEPSPLERMCAKALGIADVDQDTALVDYVRLGDQGGTTGFVPPPKFYDRFARVLAETYGPPHTRSHSQLQGRRSRAAQAGDCLPAQAGDCLPASSEGRQLQLRRVRSCLAVSEERGPGEKQCAVVATSTLQPPCVDENEEAVEGAWPRPPSYEIGVHTDLGGVPFMEDAYCVHKASGNAIFAVYDGHGGAHAAHYCREHLHRHVVASLEKGDAPAQALLTGFERTEAGLLTEQRQQGVGSTMCGATGTVALIRDGSLHMGWLGDCRAVLCRGGECIELTRDHVLRVGPAADGSEHARVLGEGGHVEGGRLSGFLEVARAFGDLDQSTGRKPPGLSGTPELRSQPLHAEDEFVLVASDELWRLLESQAAVRLARQDLRAHANVAMAAERLVEEALLTRRADDNITVLLVLLRPVCPDVSVRQRPKLQLLKRGASVPTSLSAATGLNS